MGELNMEKCHHCGEEYDILKLDVKYCIECGKCGDFECSAKSRVVKDFKFKDEKGAFVKCSGCDEKIYEEIMIYKCPNCKKELKHKSKIPFWGYLRK